MGLQAEVAWAAVYPKEPFVIEEPRPSLQDWCSSVVYDIPGAADRQQVFLYQVRTLY